MDIDLGNVILMVAQILKMAPHYRPNVQEGIAMRDIDRRLRTLEHRAQLQDCQDDGAALVIVSPDKWPQPVQDAYAVAAACGDHAAHSAIIEEMIGTRLARDGRIVLIINRLDGPG